jgi:hypothetical protein
VSNKASAAGEAVLYPLLSRAAFAGIVVISLMTIAAAVLLLPESLESCQRSCEQWAGLFETARAFPGIKGISDVSRFPLAAAIGHFSVLVLGIASGVSLAFTRFDNVDVTAGVNAGGWSGRVLRMLAAALVGAQFFVGPPEMNEHQFSYRFFESMSYERDTFLMWMAGIYLGSMAVVLCLVAELSELISRRWTWLR